jgi:ribokinase
VPRVLVVGSANVDLTVAVARLPEPGETVTNGTLLVSRGGKGANQAVAARRLGADVRLIGCVGADASGAEIRTALAAEGIDTAAVMTTAAAATGTALIIVDRDGGNQIAVAPGANRALTVAHVEERAADFAWAEVVVASCEVPLPVVRAALALARRGRVTTILNPAPVPDTRLDFLDLVDYLTPNAGEAARLSGVPARDDPDGARAVAALRGRGAGCVIITVGARGAIVWRDRERVVVPAPRVQAVDTTGAGDAFNGALAVALAERRPLADALRFSNAAAALACTRRGAQPALPSRGEVERLLA